MKHFVQHNSLESIFNRGPYTGKSVSILQYKVKLTGNWMCAEHIVHKDYDFIGKKKIQTVINIGIKHKCPENPRHLLLSQAH